MTEWNYASAAHLLRRAGFGAPRHEVLRAVRRGHARTVSSLLAFRPSAAQYRGTGDFRAASRWWLARMLSGSAPLREKLTLFWHGHFATSVAKVEEVPLMALQNATFRRHAAGRFADLVLAVSRDPAMIVWLDNLENVKGSPNENYARELMELFTLGVADESGNPNYTEHDVRELARCFTGWYADGPRFVFRPEDHDDGVKTFSATLGAPTVSGDGDAEAVIAYLVRTPACARFVVRKLWTFFAYPDPEPAVVDDLAAVYLASDTSLAPVLRALFLRDEFLSERARTARVSSPTEWAVGALRTLGARAGLSTLPFELSDMGQSLFRPPNVAGWPGGLAWITSVTRLARHRFAWDAVTGRTRASEYRTQPRRLLRGLPPRPATADVVDRILETLGAAVPAEARDALVAYADDFTDAPGLSGPFDARNAAHVDAKVRGVAGLALTSAEGLLA